MPQQVNLNKLQPLFYGEPSTRLTLDNIQKPYSSHYDENYRPEMNSQLWNRSDNQSGTGQLWNGLVSRSASIPLKLLGGVSNVLGVFTAGYGSGELNQIWDNPINQAMDQADQSLRDMFPVYNSAKYDEGGLFKKMMTTSFWANDMFDGLAYLASAYVPSVGVGAAVSAAGKALTLAEETANLVKGLRAIGMTTNRASMLGTSIFNTISEAGAEAYQTKHEVMASLMQDPSMTYEKAQKLSSEAAAGTFGWNSAILMGPNLVQSSWFHGGWGDKVSKVRNAVLAGKGTATGEVTSVMKSILQEAAIGFGSEGLWEENVQSAIQRYESSWASGKEHRDSAEVIAEGMWTNLKGLGKSFLPGSKLTPDEMEGALSIALGGIIGMHGGAIAGFKEAKEYNRLIDTEQNRYKDLREKYGSAAERIFVNNVKSIYDKEGEVTIKQEDGSEIKVPKFTTTTDEEGNVSLKKDFEGIAKGIFVQLRNKQLYDHAGAAALASDPIYDEFNKQMALASYAHDLATKGYSKEEINGYLDELTTIGSEEAKQLGVTSYIADNLARVKEYVADFEQINKVNSSARDFSTDPEEFKFKHFLNKTSYYLNAKRKALENSLLDTSISDKAREGLKTVLDDVISTQDDIRNNKEEIRKDYFKSVVSVQKMFMEAEEIKSKPSKTEEEVTRLRELDYKMMEDGHINGTANRKGVSPNLAYGLDQESVMQVTYGSRHEHYFNAGRQIMAINHINENIETEDPVKLADKALQHIQYMDDPAKEAINSIQGQLTMNIMQSSLDGNTADNKLAAIQSLKDSAEMGDDVEEAAVDLIREDLVNNGVLSGDGMLNTQDLESPEVLDILDQLQEEYAAKSTQAGAMRAHYGDAMQKLEEHQQRAFQDSAAVRMHTMSSSGQEEFLVNEFFDKYVTAPFAIIKKAFDAYEDYKNQRIKNGDSEAVNEFDDENNLNIVYHQILSAEAAFATREGFEDIKLQIQRMKDFIDNEIRPVVMANQNRRVVAQREANNAHVGAFINQLDLIKDLVYEIIGAAKFEEVKALITADLTHSYDGLLNLIDTIKERMTDDQAKAFFTKLGENKQASAAKVIAELKRFTKGQESEVRREDLYPSNPDGMLGFYIANMFYEYIENPESFLYKFTLDNNLAALEEAAKADKSLPEDYRKGLLNVLELHKSVQSAYALEQILRSKLDFSTLQEAKEKILGDSRPTPQQNIVLTEALYALTVPGTKMNFQYRNWTLIQGIAGSGKSFVVARTIVDLLKKLDPSANIVATSAQQFTADNINNAIFGDGHPKTSFEEVMRLEPANNLVIVLDEIFTFTNSQLTEVVERFQNSGTRIIALGDPSQVSVDDNVLDLLVPTIGREALRLPALVSSYRTNIPAIASLNSAYQMNHLKVDSVFSQANKSTADSMADLSGTMGVHSGDKEQLRAMLKTPTTRSRVLIVSDNIEKQEYKHDFPTLQVLTYREAQGYQWDEVFVSLSPNKMGASPIEQNRGIYTALSRAKQYIFAEGLPITTTVNDKISTTIEQNVKEIIDNVDLFKENLATSRKISNLFGKKATPKVVTNPVVIVDEEENFEGPKAEPDEGIVTVLPKVPRIDVADITPPPPPSVPKGNYSLAHPINRKIVSGEVAPGDIVHIVRGTSKGNEPTYYVIKETTPNNWIVVARIGNKDITHPDFEGFMSQVMKLKPKVSLRDSVISEEGFSLPSIGAYSLGTLRITDATKMGNLPAWEYTGPNMIEQAILYFVSTYFGTDAYGRTNYPAETDTPSGVPDLSKHWVVNGKVNWDVVGKHVRVVISTKSMTLKGKSAYIEGAIPNFNGIPYLVITNPNQAGNKSGISKPILIPLLNGRYNTKSKYYESLRKFYDAATVIENLTGLPLGSEEFTKLVESHSVDFGLTKNGKRYEVTRTSKNITTGDVSLDAAIESLISVFYGADKKPIRFATEVEARDFISKHPSGKAMDVAEGKGSHPFSITITNSDDSVSPYKEYRISRGKGPAQVGFNSVAAANPKVQNSKGEWVHIRATYGAGVTKDGKGITKNTSILSDKFFTDFHSLYDDESIGWKGHDGQTIKPGEFKTREHLLNYLLKTGQVKDLDEFNEKLKNHIHPPVTTAMLEYIVGDDRFNENGEHEYLFNPLQANTMDGTGISDIGKDLSKLSARATLGELLSSNYGGTQRTTLTVEPLAFEQELKEFKPTTVKEALDKRKMSKVEKALFDLISPYIDSIKIEFSAFDGFNFTADQKVAAYNTVLERIQSNTDPAKLPVWHILHEAVHALTIKALVEKATPNQKAFAERITFVLEKLRAYAQKNKLDLKEIFSDTISELDEKELIANLSNPKMLDILKKIKIERKSALTKIIDAILELLGINTVTADKFLVKSLQEFLDPTLPIDTEQSIQDAEDDFDIDPDDLGFAISTIPTEVSLSTPGQLTSEIGLRALVPFLVTDRTLTTEGTNLLRSIMNTELIDPDTTVVKNLIGQHDLESIVRMLIEANIITNRDLINIRKEHGLPSERHVVDFLLSIPNAYTSAIMDVVDLLRSNESLVQEVIGDAEQRSIARYEIARNFIIEELEANSKTETSFRKTREEAINDLFKKLKDNSEGSLRDTARKEYEAQLVRLGKATDPKEVFTITNRDLPNARNKHAAVEALTKNNQITGKLLFNDILAEISPKNKISAEEDIELYIDEMDTPGLATREDAEARTGANISEHIKKYDKSAELTLSESIKDYLSLIRAGDRLLNPSFSYIKTLQYLVEHDMTAIVTSKVGSLIDAWLGTIENTFKEGALSPEDIAILNNLKDLINTAITDRIQRKTEDGDITLEGHPLPEDLAFVTNVDKSGVYYRIIMDEDAHTRTEESATKISPRFKSAREMVKYLEKTYPNPVPILVFNTLMDKANAINLLRELQNSMMSMKETELMVGTRSNKKGLTIAYMRSKAIGISNSFKEQIKETLKILHETGRAVNISSGFKSAFPESRDIIFNPTRKTSYVETLNAIRDFYSYLGLGDVASQIAFSPSEVDNVKNRILYFNERTITNLENDKVISELQSLEFDTESERSVDEFVKNMDGIINELAEYAAKTTTYLRNMSVKSAKGEKFYKIHESSWMYDTVLNLIKTRSNSLYKGTSGGGQKFRFLPDFMLNEDGKVNDFYKDNLFVKGLSKIDFIGEHEALKNVDNSSVTMFDRENKNFFYHREVLQGFLDGIRQYGDRFFLFSHIPSDKPKSPLFRVNLLSQDAVVTALEDMVQHMRDRVGITMNTKKAQDSYENDFFRNFTALERAFNPAKFGDKAEALTWENSNKEIAQRVNEIIELEAAELTKQLIDVKFTIDIATISNISNRVVKPETFFKDWKNFSGMEKVFSKTSEGDYNEAVMEPILRSLIDSYVKNHYVSSYSLHNLFVGDQLAYKGSSWEIIKRMAGMLAPGIRGLVDEKYGIGMKELYKVLVVKDQVIDVATTAERMKNILFPANHTLTESEQEEFDKFMEQFSAYEIADAQGFMLPSRKAELEKGFGRAWGMGNVMKPVHFEVQAKKLAKGEGTYTTAMPIYTKYSSVVLTDDLVKRFPTLGKLRAKIEEAGADELVFDSGVKTGTPLTVYTMDDMLNPEMKIGAMELKSSMLTLSNRQFRLQHNPASNPAKDVSIFTQLMYFLSAYESTKTSADTAYNLVAELISDGREEFLSQVDTPSKMRKFFASKFSGPGSERALQLLSSGINFDSPLLEKKAIISLASGIESATVKIKFNGGKLVLQTAKGIELYQETTNLDKKKARGLRYRRETVNGKSIMVAEVIVPAGLLSQEQIEAVQKGESIYLLPDGMGYRIPSTELHSAVPLRVVGIYDNENTNVIIAPQDLVPIHGSDFDVDALFIVMPDKYEKTKEGNDETREFPVKAISTMFNALSTFNSQYNAIVDSLNTKDAIELNKLYLKLNDEFVEMKETGVTKYFEHVQSEIEDFKLAHPELIKNKQELKNLFAELKAAQTAFKASEKIIALEGAPVGYVKKNGKYVFAPEQLDIIKDRIDTLSEMYESLKSNPDLRYLLPIVRTELKTAKEIKSKFMKNAINNTMLEVISDVQANGYRMLSPISFTALEEASNLIPDRLKPPTTIDLSSTLDKFKAYLSLVDGKILTGAFANAVKVFAYTSRAGFESKEYLELKNEYEQLQQSRPSAELDPVGHSEIGKQMVKITKRINAILEEASKEKTRPYISSDYTFTINIDGKDEVFNRFVEKDVRNQHGTTAIFDALLNAAIDNLKMQLLPQLKINTHTGSAVVGMVALGVPIDIITKILNTAPLAPLSTGDLSRFKDFRKESLKEIEDQDIATLTMEDLDRALAFNASGEEVPTKSIANIHASIVDIFFKAHKVGEDIRNLASFLDIIRGFDVFVEDMETRESDFNSKIGSYKDGKFKTKNDFSLLIPGLFENNPHIKEAYKTTQTLQELIDDNFIQHSPIVREFVEGANITGLTTSSEVENANVNQAIARRTLIRTILNGLIWDDIKDTPIRTIDLKFDPSKQIQLSVMRSYSENVLDNLTSLRKYYQKEFKAKAENRFLDLVSSYYSSAAGTKVISLNGGVNLNAMDIQKIYQGFKALSTFHKVDGKWTRKATTQISPIQKQLLIYAILNYGLEFSTSNYANVIDSRLIKQLDERLRSTTRAYLADATQDKKDLFRLSYYLMNADRLPYLPSKSFWKEDPEEKFSRRNGMDIIDGTKVYFDLKWVHPESIVGESLIAPDYISQSTTKGPIKMYKKVFQTEDEKGVVTNSYYQYVGKSSDAFLLPLMQESYNISEKFNASVPTVIYHSTNTSKDILYSTQDMSSFLKKGDVILASPSYDPSRQSATRYQIVSIEKTTKDGFNTYGYKVEPVIEFNFAQSTNVEDEINNILNEKDQGCNS